MRLARFIANSSSVGPAQFIKSLAERFSRWNSQEQEKKLNNAKPVTGHADAQGALNKLFID